MYLPVNISCALNKTGKSSRYHNSYTELIFHSTTYPANSTNSLMKFKNLNEDIWSPKCERKHSKQMSQVTSAIVIFIFVVLNIYSVRAFKEMYLENFNTYKNQWNQEDQ